MSDNEHLHLSYWGYEVCRVENCTRPTTNPDDDMICTDPNCEGNCEAARFNKERRRHLAGPKL